MLRHEGYTEVRVPVRRPDIRSQFADDEARERGLPGTVRPDDAHAALQAALHGGAADGGAAAAGVRVVRVLQVEEAPAPGLDAWQRPRLRQHEGRQGPLRSRNAAVASVVGGDGYAAVRRGRRRGQRLWRRRRGSGRLGGRGCGSASSHNLRRRGRRGRLFGPWRLRSVGWCNNAQLGIRDLLHEAGKVALVRAQLPAVHVDDVRADAVQEGGVVRDHQAGHRAPPVFPQTLHIVNKPSDVVRIKVPGGLIQQQHVSVLQHGPDQAQLHAPAAAQRPDRLLQAPALVEAHGLQR
mmetsp:Transcript_110017/g.350405  ORF Transcript_110017/g.350405 Transcript_110017/m.350405 type:complete len:294 (+) Transcript_110017:978-1859(+)